MQNILIETEQAEAAQPDVAQPDSGQPEEKQEPEQPEDNAEEVGDAANEEEAAEVLPETMQVSELKAANTNNTDKIKIGLYTEESNKHLTDVWVGNGQFSGEKEIDGEPNPLYIKETTDYKNREYRSATFYIEGGEAEFPLTGIYQYQIGNSKAWYYTVGEETGEAVSVARKLDENAKLKAYYAITQGKDVKLEPKVPTGETELWNVSCQKTAKPRQKVVVGFSVPAKYEFGKLTIKSGDETLTVGTFHTDKKEAVGNVKYPDLIDESSQRYEAVFEVPDEGKERLTLTFEGIEYKNVNDGRWFGLIFPRETNSVPLYEGDDIKLRTLKIGNRNVSQSDEYRPKVRRNYVPSSSWTSGTGHETSEDKKEGTNNANEFKLKNIKYSDASGAKQTAAEVSIGKYKLGEAIELELESLSYSIAYDKYMYEPMNIWVECYEGQDQWGTENMVSTKIVLPQNQGESVTAKIDGGGTATITCQLYQNEKPQNSQKEFPRFRYKIVLKNMRLGFQVVVNRQSTAQENVAINSGEGIELSEKPFKSGGYTESEVTGSRYISGKSDRSRSAYPINSS